MKAMETMAAVMMAAVMTFSGMSVDAASVTRNLEVVKQSGDITFAQIVTEEKGDKYYRQTSEMLVSDKKDRLGSYKNKVRLRELQNAYSSEEEAFTVATKYIAQELELPAVYYVVTDSSPYMLATGGMQDQVYVSARYLYTVATAQEELNEYLDDIRILYVRDGDSADRAATATALYVAACLEDNHDSDHAYDFHGRALEAGTGYPEDYAGLYATFINMIPFDEDGYVDWTDGEPGYMNARVVSNDGSAFNVVATESGDRFVDVAWYDFTGDEGYLNMTAELLADGYHAIESVR